MAPRVLPLDDVVQVRFVREEHPDIQRWRARVSEQQQKSIRQHQSARARERLALEALLGLPFAAFSTAEALWQTIIALGWVDPTRRCSACRFGRPDRSRSPGYVCWDNWPGHGPPRRLRTLDPCHDFAWQVGLEWQCRTALQQRGARYSPERWKWHRADLGLAQERIGFQAGIAWEQRVRTWLATRPAPVQFVPQRWLIARDRQGQVSYRQVDGCERWDTETAFVYEIKRNDSGYEQLTATYIPLLRMAFPWMRFVPLELTSLAPAHGAPANQALTHFIRAQWDKRGIAELPSLDHRHPDLGYQLYAPRADEVPYTGDDEEGMC